VVVSAVLSRASPAASVVSSALGGALDYVVSPALLGEYHRALGYPRVAQHRGFDRSRATTLVRDLEYFGMVVVPDSALRTSPDPGDQHLWDLLASVPDAILVTGDRRLLESGDYPGRVLSPRAFVDRFLAAADD
jgi:predicted nucleic acid-binding protein